MFGQSRTVTLLVLACVCAGAVQATGQSHPLRTLEALGHDTTPANLQRLLTDDEREMAIRCLSAYALGASKTEAGLSVLLSATAAPNATLRNAVAQALGSTQSAAAVPPLIELLLTDTDELVRYAAGQSLEQLGGMRAAQALLGPALNAAESELIRLAAIESLARMAPELLALHGDSLLSQHDPSVRALTAIGLSRRADARAMPVLVDAILSTRTPDHIQDDAIRALERVASRQFFPSETGPIAPTAQQARALAVLAVGAWWAEHQTPAVGASPHRKERK